MYAASPDGPVGKGECKEENVKDKNLREIAIKLATENGTWTDCRPLFAEIKEALKEAGRFGPIVAMDRIHAHMDALEDERWESVQRGAWAQMRMMQMYQCMVGFVCAVASEAEAAKKDGP